MSRLNASLCLATILAAAAVPLSGCADGADPEHGPDSAELRGQEVHATAHSGQATGATAVIGAISVVVVETGQLPESGGALEDSLLDVDVPGVLTADIVHGVSVGGDGQVASEASTSALSLTVGGHTIESNTLYALTEVDCGEAVPSASAYTIVEDLIIDGIAVTVTGEPNQVIALPVGAIVINGQATSTSGNAAEASARALRILIPDVADVSVAIADSGVACVYHEDNCQDGLDDDDDGFIDCDDSDCDDAPNCNPETICDDGVDNDSDGQVDCDDWDCNTAPICNPETACDDGIDNDFDGAIDCADADCAAAPNCNPETECTDGLDNDQDGLADCDDPDCQSCQACQPETICDDGTDNDGDGDIDCADSDCADATVCQPEAECGDGIDNDADGDVDCDDADCANNEACLPDPCDKITGGGYIKQNGKKKNFSVAGGYKNGAYWGHLNFHDKGTGMHVKGTGVTGYEILDATTRRITGTAKIDNAPGYTYTATVSDNGEPGTQDVFNLSLSNGYTTGNNLTCGNIQLHKECSD